MNIEILSTIILLFLAAGFAIYLWYSERTIKKELKRLKDFQEKETIKIIYDDGTVLTFNTTEKGSAKNVFEEVIDWYYNWQRRYFKIRYNNGETILDRKHIVLIDRKKKDLWEEDQK